MFREINYDSFLSRAWLRKCDQIGLNCRALGRPYIENLGSIKLGDEVFISSRPVRSHLVAGPNGTLVLGNRVHVGYGAAIAAHREIIIGEGARLGPFVMLMDSDFHAAEDRDVPIAARPIKIGRNVSLGTRCVVLPGSVIGDDAIIEAGSVVSGSIPQGATAGGVPARCKTAEQDSVEERDHDSLESLESNIARLVKKSLGLASLPRISDGPNNISAWDSLGSLNLILAVEEEFKVTISQDDWIKIKSICGLANLVRSQQK